MVSHVSMSRGAGQNLGDFPARSPLLLLPPHLPAAGHALLLLRVPTTGGSAPPTATGTLTSPAADPPLLDESKFVRLTRRAPPLSIVDWSIGQCDGLRVGNDVYPADEWTNVPPHILQLLPRKLHLQPGHPIAQARELIEARFPAPTYTAHNTLEPIVSVAQNFDSLNFPAAHPGRSRTDTYYVNASTVLRTHTSAHQAELFRSAPSPGFLISADVYRRDAIDCSHYPVFHQMEGARMWSRKDGDVAEQIRADLEHLPKHDLQVEDLAPEPGEDNPLQPAHTKAEAAAIAAHLKRSIEGFVVDVFGRARAAAAAAGELSGEASVRTLHHQYRHHHRLECRR